MFSRIDFLSKMCINKSNSFTYDGRFSANFCRGEIQQLQYHLSLKNELIYKTEDK